MNGTVPQTSEAWGNLVAHIDQHVASQVRAARDAALEEAVMACDELTKLNREQSERHAGPNDEDYDGYVDAYLNKAFATSQCAEVIRTLKGRPAISHSGEGERGGAA